MMHIHSKQSQAFQFCPAVSQYRREPRQKTNNTCPISIETTFVGILIHSDLPTQTIQEPQSGVFCIPNYQILHSKAKKVVSRSDIRWHILSSITLEKSGC